MLNSIYELIYLTICGFMKTLCILSVSFIFINQAFSEDLYMDASASPQKEPHVYISNKEFYETIDQGQNQQVPVQSQRKNNAKRERIALPKKSVSEHVSENTTSAREENVSAGSAGNIAIAREENSSSYKSNSASSESAKLHDEFKRWILEKQRQLNNRELELIEKEKKLSSLEEEFLSKQNLLTEHERVLFNKECELNEKQIQLADLEKFLQTQEKEFASTKEKLNAKEMDLLEKELECIGKEKLLISKEEELIMKERLFLRAKDKQRGFSAG